MAFMARGLLMLSVAINDVSSEAGRDAWKIWKAKLVGSASHMKTRSARMYCAPTLALRFSHFGCSGSAGGRTGLGPTWQKVQLIPTRYGLARSFEWWNARSS